MVGKREDNQLETGRISILAIASLGISVLVGVALLATAPKTKPEAPEREVAKVDVQTMEVATWPLMITAYGELIPWKQARIESEVVGNVTFVPEDLAPGGVVREGQPLFRVDPALAELAVAENRALLERAKAETAEAERQRDQAKELASNQVIPDTDLAALEARVLTERADLERQRSVLKRSEILLERHVPTAPFDALVLDVNVEVGERVSQGVETVSLVATERFWARVSLPLDELVRLEKVGAVGASANVFLETGLDRAPSRDGRVARVLGNLGTEGRLARLLVEVEDPFSLNSEGQQAPFLLGSFVRVEIDAGALENVVAIERRALREEDQVWLVGADSRLRIREATVVWTDEDLVYIEPVAEAGERLIVSALKEAAPEMQLTVQNQTEGFQPSLSGGTIQ